MQFEYADGATPLDADLIAGLIPGLSTQAELNEFEAYNIATAMLWAQRSRRLKKNLLSVEGLCLLHRRMFDQTWRWAGQFRQVDTNIGVSWYLAPAQTHALCGDVLFQVEHAVYTWDELAVRFHHRLVSIHPFPNGNGRHARLATDLLLEYHGQQAFTWGAVSLVANSSTRRAYLDSLREADNGNIDDLMNFVRS